MKASPEQDWLDKALSQEADYIEDAGFTDALMQRLPPRKARRKRLHAAILIGAGLLSLAVPIISVALNPELYAGFADSLLRQPLPLLGLVSVALCAVSALLAGWFLRLDQ